MSTVFILQQHWSGWNSEHWDFCGVYDSFEGIQAHYMQENGSPLLLELESDLQRIGVVRTWNGINSTFASTVQRGVMHVRVMEMEPLQYP